MQHMLSAHQAAVVAKPRGVPVQDYAFPAPGFCVRKLAGHLVSMLEACAELTRCDPLDATDAGVGGLRRAELGAITHLLQARACAHDASLEDLRLGECVDFFIAGTQVLEQAPVVPLGEPMLGQRLAVAIAVQFARVMLDVLAALYPVPAASAPAPDARFAGSRETVRAA